MPYKGPDARAKVAESKRKSIARGNDISAKLEQAREGINKRRRSSCKKSFWKFITTYCMDDGGFFAWSPYAETRQIVDTMQKSVTSGQYYHIRMTRGGGKTSLMLALIAWCICYGLSKYVVISASVKPQASVMLEDIWSLFENGEEIGEDFPEICLPIRELGGSAQRAISQHVGGKRTCIKRSDKFIYFPTVDGSDASGAILVAVGFDGRVRGLRKGKLRPDLVLLDDLQDDEMAQSAEQVDKARTKIAKSYLGLGSSRHRVSVLMTSTPICVNDLSEQYAEDPKWITQTFPLMWTMPKRMDLWNKYAQIQQGAVAERDFDSTAARDFYLANRKVMDECEVDELGRSGPLWFKCHDDTEVSAVQHAMNILYGPDGERLFDSEYQMKPQRAATFYDIDYQTVLNNCNGLPAFTVPRVCSRLVATIDVMRNAGLRYAVTAIGPERVAAVVTYGRYPADGSPLYGPKAGFAEQDSAVSRALNALVSDLEMHTFVGEDGKRRFRIGAIGIDSGWKTRAVYTFCRDHEGCLALKGTAWDKFTPRTDIGRLRNGVVDATDWCYEKSIGYEPFVGQTFIAFHSDYWRETAQRSWFNAPMSPGSLSVFGRPAQHMQFAQECVADRLVVKDKLRSGADVWKWACNGANHLGDCVTMALAIAHWKHAYGVSGSDERSVAPADSRTETRQRQVRRASVVCL